MWWQANGIAPLVHLLVASPQEISAELAAVALRNLALQNDLNRQAILLAGGLPPLLQLLSSGQERLVAPLNCEVCCSLPHHRAISLEMILGLCCGQS